MTTDNLDSILKISPHFLERADLEVVKDLRGIEEIFRRENENMKDWRLDEISAAGCYWFSNDNQDLLSFENLLNEDGGTVVPSFVDSNNKKQKASSITDSIRRNNVASGFGQI